MSLALQPKQHRQRKHLIDAIVKRGIKDNGRDNALRRLHLFLYTTKYRTLRLSCVLNPLLPFLPGAAMAAFQELRRGSFFI